MTVLRLSFPAPRTARILRRHRALAGRPGGRTRKSNFIPRLTALEDRILLATLIVDPAGGTGIFTTIQAAVDAANAAGGDTIEIHPATYTEQVTINKSLTMLGTGPGTTIQAPSTLTPDTFGLRVLVEVNNAAVVDMSNLTVSGPAPSLNAGILIVGGATANVTGTTVTQIQDPATFGNQTGFGIQIGGTGSQAVGEVGHATITGCTITAYQKVGIIVGRSDSTGTITDTTITGVGPTPQIAQNGIQIGPGSANATVSNTTISRNQFTGTGGGPDPNGVQSAGILNFIASSSIMGSTVVDNDMGIFSTNSGSTSPGSTITGNTVQLNLEGIFLAQGTANVTNNIITENNIGVALFAFAGDTTDTVGSIVSNDITNNGNGGLSFPGGGIRLLTESGATTTAQATAQFNRIVGNAVGLDNTTAAAVDATLNWWGGNAGPNTTGNDTTSGDVNTEPWLVMGLSSSLATIGPGGTAVVTADLTKDSNGATHSTAPFFPNDIPIAFSATGGTIAPASVLTLSGLASSDFTSSAPATASASVTLDNQSLSTPITIQPINVSPPPTPQQTTVGQPFSQSFEVTGGAGGFVYAVSTGMLPPGLALDPNTGLLTGSTTTPGTFAFTVSATDLSTASVSENLTIVVNPSIVINPHTPPQGVVGAPYTDQLSATGGTGTIIFTLAAGTTLPPGLSLSNTGLITGTPTTVGTFPFTVTATDQTGASASLPLSIVVVPAQAPTVQSLERFGFHAQPTVFVLTFSTALDPARAQDVTNYRLTPISGNRLGRDIPITAAIYDTVANTVTLQPAVRVYLFRKYRLVVNGSTPTGVAGATGLLLDGAGTGQPGSDFVRKFGRNILAGPNPSSTAPAPSSSARKLSTGPHRKAAASVAILDPAAVDQSLTHVNIRRIQIRARRRT
jgi:hypothetical protein